MKINKFLRGKLVAIGLLCSVSTVVPAGDTPAPESAKTYFINIKDGDKVSSPMLIQFGLSGMGVAPAGNAQSGDTGHHHLLIDSELTGEALNLPVPSDDQHRHFGKGQTETSIELTPGAHVLQLVLGDWKHTPHSTPIVSDRIMIVVE